MEFPIIINWTSPFPFQGLLGCILSFYQNSNRTFSKQTVETLIRSRVLRHLIRVCTVCLCPTKKALGLNGLKHCMLGNFNAFLQPADFFKIQFFEKLFQEHYQSVKWFPASPVMQFHAEMLNVG